MLKMLLPLLLLCGSIPTYAEEITLPTQSSESNTEIMALTYVGFGCGYILVGQFEGALATLEMAEAQLATLEKRAPEADFMLAFAKIVAYDNLNMRQECEQAVGSMFIALANIDTSEDEIDDEDDAFTQEFFHQLAMSASSPDIREILLMVIDEMQQED